MRKMGMMTLTIIECLLVVSQVAKGDFTFGTPTNLGPIVNGADDVSGVSISADGLELYFASNRPGGYGSYDLWVATRATTDNQWDEPTNLGPIVNSRYTCINPSISTDGRILYFSDDDYNPPCLPGGVGSSDAWMVTRETKDAPWSAPVNVGPRVNYAGADITPNISADELSLFFASGPGRGGSGLFDLWVATRATRDRQWGTPVNLGATVNSAAAEITPSISADALMLFFCRTFSVQGGFDLWMTRRATADDEWGPPIKLGNPVNTSASEGWPSISADGSTLYFCFDRAGGFGQWDIWQVSILPVIDFNGDGQVDAKDMGLLADNWGQNKPLCDIGPLPWGDGVVDERDLRVLMESLVTPGPKASDVACDVVLTWISPSFASTCDVYLGTSQEAVNSASRTNPQGVLASQGQTGTTYDPPDPLEFSKTYYWRVDFVISGPTPVIYQGPVLKFTTEAFARPIKNPTATASSAQRGMGPEKTVNGSGLDKSDGHSTDGADMWLSMAVVPPHWIQYEFDQVYALHELWVWNSNQLVEPFIGFGAKTVKIEYSVDGTTWTALANVPEFAKASGKPGYTANTKISFSGVSAKYVKLTIEKGWGATPSVGLSEVRFFCIPDRTATKP